MAPDPDLIILVDREMNVICENDIWLAFEDAYRGLSRRGFDHDMPNHFQFLRFKKKTVLRLFLSKLTNISTLIDTLIPNTKFIFL